MYLLSSSYRVPQIDRRFARPVHYVDLCYEIASETLSNAGVNPEVDDVMLILSTTKGDNLYLQEPAAELASRLHFHMPLVVSNACISGVAAQLVAARLMQYHDYILLVGCDLITPFIESGFTALHAVSNEPCRPFDRDRQGLNLGEAAAAMLFTSCPAKWKFISGTIHNDANHITGPSRVGEGSYRCLMDLMTYTTPDTLACVSVHGTGTLYNDEMESIALFRAGLINVPVCAYKGVYGHTLGAAGVLETILTMQALEKGMIPATVGFVQQGTSYPVAVSTTVRSTNRCQFIKLLSGFGGCNAAALWEYQS